MVASVYELTTLSRPRHRAFERSLRLATSAAMETDFFAPLVMACVLAPFVCFPFSGRCEDSEITAAGLLSLGCSADLAGKTPILRILLDCSSWLIQALAFTLICTAPLASTAFTTQSIHLPLEVDQYLRAWAESGVVDDTQLQCLDLQNGQNKGPYTAYTLYFGILVRFFFGLFWRSRCDHLSIYPSTVSMFLSIHLSVYLASYAEKKL